MNTNRLYIVNVYRIIETKILKVNKHRTIYSEGVYSRKTVVYDNGYGVITI